MRVAVEMGRDARRRPSRSIREAHERRADHDRGSARDQLTTAQTEFRHV